MTPTIQVTARNLQYLKKGWESPNAHRRLVALSEINASYPIREGDIILSRFEGEEELYHNPEDIANMATPYWDAIVKNGTGDVNPTIAAAFAFNSEGKIEENVDGPIRPEEFRGLIKREFGAEFDYPLYGLVFVQKSGSALIILFCRDIEKNRRDEEAEARNVLAVVTGKLI